MFRVHRTIIHDVVSVVEEIDDQTKSVDKDEFVQWDGRICGESLVRHTNATFGVLGTDSGADSSQNETDIDVPISPRNADCFCTRSTGQSCMNDFTSNFGSESSDSW